ncbi:hypothetical protein HYS47_04345 [Candidatus Woesearchaeota archaeon]|nr:hypothetical protein [Candidatus Woesearchaeota archaeon]
MILVAVILLGVLLTACVPSESDYPPENKIQVIPDQTPPAAPSQPVPSAPAPTDSPAVPVPAAPEPVSAPTPPLPTANPTSTQAQPTAPAQMDPKVKDLVERAKKKANLGYSFYFTTTDNWELWRDKYFIKGDETKIKLYQVNLYDKKNYFNTVYMNSREKSAVGYCEDPSSTRCVDPNREFKLAYDDFTIKMPMDWINEIETTKAVWIGSEQVDERLSHVVEYPKLGGLRVRVWVDSFSGIPVQVVVYGEDLEDIRERYGFRDLTVSVSSTQVRHQPI